MAWIHTSTVAPHRVTANDDVALQHASRARGLSSFFGKGREKKPCYGLSWSRQLVYVRSVAAKDLQTFFSSFYYVGFGEEQIGSRRGCGVNGGLKVTILLGCMKGSCQEASRTCSRCARSLCGNRFNCRSDSLGGKRRGQTNQGFFFCCFGSAVEYMA